MSSYRKPITTWQGLQGIQGAFLVQSKGQVHGHSALAHTTFTWGGEKALGRGSEGAHPTIKELWFFFGRILQIDIQYPFTCSKRAFEWWLISASLTRGV